MAITYDRGANWYHVDELPMAQVYAVGVDMDRPYNVYCGMQDFGSWKGPSTKKGRFPIRFEDWEHVNGGDGFYNQVDPEDSRWLYSGAQFGYFVRIDQRTGVRKTIVDDEATPHRFNWSTPLLISPHDSKTLYVGANVVLRSTSRGDSWEVVSPDLTRADETRFEGIGAVRYGTLTTISESPVEPGVLWIGTDDGNVQLSRDGGGSWRDLSRAVSALDDIDGYWVSRVAASHHDVATAYVSFTGFHRDDFRPLPYKTTDFGATWSAIGRGLPRGAVNVIREDRKNPALLFAGTDRGAFVSLDGGGNWARFRRGLPTIPVHDLVVHPRENDLVLGTHGRGVFITDISPLQELTEEVRGRPVHLFAIEPKVQWVMPSQPAVSAQNFAGPNEPSGVVIHYYLRTALEGGVRIRIDDDDGIVHELTGPGEEGLNSVEWGMIRSLPRPPEQQAEWDEGQKMLAEEVEFFDYYDTVEIPVEDDEEVDRWGRSLRTRVHPTRGLTDREVRYLRVAPGSYRVSLIVGDEVRERTAVILEDRWYAGR